jgi:gluconolactonase
MGGLVQNIVDFFKSLNLEEKLSPRRNYEIIWFYIFLPCFFLYLVFLSQYLNEKPSIGKIEVLDSSFSNYVNPAAKIEVIATGLNWAEGPLWIQDDNLPHLVFSDTILNRIYKWEEGKGMFTIGKTIYQENSGCRLDQEQCVDVYEPGSNGIVRRSGDSFDLISCLHGDRGIAIIRDNGTRSMIATHYKTSRLNSPNDLILSPEGHLYFTDPTYGLVSKKDRMVANKELNHSGVYMIKADYLQLSADMGEPTHYVRLVESKLSHPNGLAFSPDFSKMYISNSANDNTYINVYDVADDGSLVRGRIFFNASELWRKDCQSAVDQQCQETGPCDGLKVDIHGNLFASGPGGVMVISPDGILLGRIRLDRPASNVAFGSDGRLYITAKDIVARLWIKTKPARIVGKM